MSKEIKTLEHFMIEEHAALKEKLACTKMQLDFINKVLEDSGVFLRFREEDAKAILCFSKQGSRASLGQCFELKVDKLSSFVANLLRPYWEAARYEGITPTYNVEALEKDLCKYE